MSQPANRRAGQGVSQFQQTPSSKSSIISPHAKKQSGKFISHLLGLDTEHPTGGSSAGGQTIPAGMKITDALSGIKLTPNFMFFLLFFGFFCWLFVIYWVRHHEPLANQVLGTPKSNGRKATIDRQLVAGIKKTFPVQTSATSGEVYVPGMPQEAVPAQAVTAQPVPMVGSAPQVQPVQRQPYANGTQITQQGFIVNPGPGAAAANYGSPLPASNVRIASPALATTAPAPNAASPIPMAAYLPAIPVGQGNYMVGQQTNAGTRIKTIVSR